MRLKQKMVSYAVDETLHLDAVLQIGDVADVWFAAKEQVMIMHKRSQPA
jgi:hypothetical protein